MVSRKSATKSKGKAMHKGGKARGVKKGTGSKVTKRTKKTATRDVRKRKRKATVEQSTTPAESPMGNNGTIEEVRSSMDDVIDNAKKVVGVE